MSGKDLPELNNEENLGLDQRQEQITDYILRHGSASTKELASTFGVSVVTIHRDLVELERQRILRRERGGATAQPSNIFESDIRYRIKRMVREKETLAQAALAHIRFGETVMLDDSTTVLALARRLHTVTPLTVITNGLLASQELSEVRDLELISLGGTYVPRYGGFVGVICESAIDALRAEVLVMSVPAVSEGLVFHQEREIVSVKQAMMASAARRILLVDHTKLEKAALIRLAPLSDFDLVMVDAGADETALNKLRESQVSLEVVPMP